jgi:CubicO group peptidase (beta-lactamase class C family)
MGIVNHRPTLIIASTLATIITRRKLKMKLLTTILFFVLSISLAFGQLETKIDSLFAEYNNSPGCAVGIYSKGEILLKKGYGIANLDYDIKITPETVFDIGSVSKQFTAACIVLLENQGKLSLDDDIRKYIPEMPKFDEGKITIRNLLHHTSGLRDYLTLMYMSGISFDDYFTEQMGLDILVRQKELNFVPGSEFLYSNSGYLALAILIRRVSGESIGTFAQKNIFDSLDMKNTFIYEDGAKVVKNRAIGYSKEGKEYQREHHFDFVVGGDGQVYTTIEDFFKWSENFKSNKLGNDSFLNQMLTKGILSNGDTLDYALGLRHGVYKNHKTISHGGAWGAFRAHYLQFPDNDLAIAIMSNFGNVNTQQKAKQIADLILRESLTNGEVENQDKKHNTKQNFIHLETNQLENFAGSYWNETDSYARKIYVKNDTLRYFRGAGNESALAPISPNEFKMLGVNYDLRVQFSKSNEKRKMSVIVDNNEPSISHEFTPHNYTVSGLKEFTGEYYSPELNTTYKAVLKKDKLTFTHARASDMIISATKSDLFSVNDVIFKFERNANQQITGFRVSIERIKNLWFEKK